METKDYKEYTISTIKSYPLKSRKHLRELFIKNDIARKDDQTTIVDPSPVNIEGLELNQQLIKCIEQNSRSEAIFEEWEFTKDYKYSVLFSAEDFDTLIMAVSTNSAPFTKCAAPLHNEMFSPQYFDYDDKIALLKFNRKFEAVHPQTTEELFVRYPIVVAFHKIEKLVEVRFDSLKQYFMENTTSFYAIIIDDVCEYFRKNYSCDLMTLDLDFLVATVQKEGAEVRLVAETMNMANGAYAQLDVGKNEEYVLPFIGELKQMLAEYPEEFEQVPALKEAFEQFIFEKEATSDFPWIELLWENEIKTRSIHVKFTFNYCQRGYCLLQHYFNSALIGMERMNSVVKFISEARGNS